MLGYDYFYRSLIRNYVVIFGSLFDNIHIKTWDSENNTWSEDIKVPVSYGPKEKHIARVAGRETTNESVAITLPRIAFDVSGIEYDSTRALNKRNTITNINQENFNTIRTVRSPLPYNINFNLSVLAKKTEDGTKIIEQIIPFFTPEMFVSAKIKFGSENDGTSESVTLDIPIILNSVSSEEEYEGEFQTRRIISWTLDFTMKGQFYGPVSSSNIIKKSNINIIQT